MRSQPFLSSVSGARRAPACLLLRCANGRRRRARQLAAGLVPALAYLLLASGGARAQGAPDGRADVVVIHHGANDQICYADGAGGWTCAVQNLGAGKPAAADLDGDGDIDLVTNEVCLGLVPANRPGRLYRDWLGRINQVLAEQSDEVYLMMAGIPLLIKPGHF